jgi:multicomponent Na+:H+ antiporter subunit G
MTAREFLASALILWGLVFIVVASIGVLRLPDFYTRLHAQSKCDTLGAALFLGGIAIYLGWSLIALKVLAILVFLAVGNPLAAHALGRAALRSGLKPWTSKDPE